MQFLTLRVKIIYYSKVNWRAVSFFFFFITQGSRRAKDLEFKLNSVTFCMASLREYRENLFDKFQRTLVLYFLFERCIFVTSQYKCSTF